MVSRYNTHLVGVYRQGINVFDEKGNLVQPIDIADIAPPIQSDPNAVAYLQIGVEQEREVIVTKEEKLQITDLGGNSEKSFKTVYAGKLIRERDYHVLLSCKDADKEIIDNLHYWLQKIASIPVWYDSLKLPGGSSIDKELPKAIANCRSIILVLSKASIASGWIRKQYEIATEHQMKFRDFHIIPVRIEECDPPDYIGPVNIIDLYSQGLDLDNASSLLYSLYYNDIGFEFEKPEIYVSRTWREDKHNEVELADYVCKLLIDTGFRLIGDSKD
jgi:TIR domain